MSADPLASRTRASPSSQRNGLEDRRGPQGEDGKGPPRQTHQEHLSTGPASWAAKGCSYSNPYIDCSDLDSGYEEARDQACRSHTNDRQQRAMLRRGSDTGSIKGALQSQQQHFLGRMQCRDSPSSRKRREIDECIKQSYQRENQVPVHGTVADVDAHSREQHSNSPLTVQHTMGLKSAITSYVRGNFSQIGSHGYADQNGPSVAPPQADYGINIYQGSRSEEGPPHCGGSSPIPSRSPYLQKRHGSCNQSVRDARNTNQKRSSQEHQTPPILSRAERMAALERRMVANGLSAPGRARARASSLQKHTGQPGVPYVGAVQINHGSTTSGSESSESEPEATRGNSTSPLMCGDSVEANPSSPLPRCRYSSDSLQLDEEADEDEGRALSDEDGGQIFSC